MGEVATVVCTVLKRMLSGTVHNVVLPKMRQCLVVVKDVNGLAIGSTKHR